MDPIWGFPPTDVIQLTVHGVVTPTNLHQQHTIAVSVFYLGNDSIGQTTLQLIDGTYTCKYSSTTATGW